ncbi:MULTISPECIES: hypothetical protein [unclassified Streptomyces]|nr:MULTISPECIES: hypothetical protein [unclassified Streptomyces]WSP53100.1 hypothetical protein OG306_00545 [Streptomyces sp. NBC_01241]WSU26183.1 hypothetical protein OG508_38480 [Streptomyces sp. NBC_01108]MCX4791742.1 hypothetical protein [Streptomyces sp. NBC_01221]MCX4799424.1 hypothetical protein [Streptomyces sp. NBC_01242]WSJ40706.1 hypothetical protein OG772_35450 [Streptomyces sp. NBC_01321]
MIATAVLAGCRIFVGVVFLVSFVGKVRVRERYTDFIKAAGELAPGLPP